MWKFPKFQNFFAKNSLAVYIFNHQVNFLLWPQVHCGGEFLSAAFFGLFVLTKIGIFEPVTEDSLGWFDKRMSSFMGGEQGYARPVREWFVRITTLSNGDHSSGNWTTAWPVATSTTIFSKIFKFFNFHQNNPVGSFLCEKSIARIFDPLKTLRWLCISLIFALIHISFLNQSQGSDGKKVGKNFFRLRKCAEWKKQNI